MKTEISKHILIGLPSTGKTTFLAAFWHVVESTEIPGSLLLKELQGDWSHLNLVRDRWLRCEPMGRTAQSGDTMVSMRLTDPSLSMITEVLFPDMAGETFNLHWLDRRWSKDYDDLVREASGLLLFVHPQQVVDPTRIFEANELVDTLDGNKEKDDQPAKNGDSDDGSAEEDTVPWAADSATTQVKLVDFLQFFIHRKESRHIFKISVIISAWDLVTDQGQSPEEWLSSRMPFLAQFLRANSELLPSNVFGVSAQGGKYPDNAKTLLLKMRPSERIIVVGSGYSGNDVTMPVKWLMT